MNETLKTIGVSPKAVWAALAPVVLAALVSTASWIQSGSFNAQEIKVAAAGVLSGFAAHIGAKMAKPGQVVAETEPTDVSASEQENVGPASDALLASQLEGDDPPQIGASGTANAGVPIPADAPIVEGGGQLASAASPDASAAVSHVVGPPQA